MLQIDRDVPTPLILIVGPIAGGKSTLARALAESLRGDGKSAALVELDQIADMARPALPDWNDAHEIFGTVVGRWLGAGLDAVIAEGPGSVEEVDLVLRQVPEGTPVATVGVTTSYDIGSARARADPTRGVSRDPKFLGAAYQRWEQELPRIQPDLLIDTGSTSVDEDVARIRTVLADAPLHRGAAPGADQPVHHIELWTHDLAEVDAGFDWLLGELGWEARHDPQWPAGRTWHHRSGAYIVLEQSPAIVGTVHDRMRPGLNHLALRLPAGRADLLDRLRDDTAAYGWSELFAEQYPHAGGPQHTALFLENAQGFEVEIVLG